MITDKRWRHGLMAISLLAMVTACGAPPQEASEYQQAILADGVVTAEEMEQSQRDTEACLVKAGLVNISFENVDSERYSVGYEEGPAREGESEDEASERYSQAADACFDEYHDDVAAEWIAQFAGDD